MYVEGGLDALADKSPRPKSVYIRIPQQVRDDFIEFALDLEALTSRELAIKYTDEKRCFISKSSAYRISKAADLSTILDDYSCYIIAWKLCTIMRANDVTDSLEVALEVSGCDQAAVRHKPRLLSDNGSFYILRRSGRVAEEQAYEARSGRAISPQNTGQNQMMASDHEEPGSAGKLLPAW